MPVANGRGRARPAGVARNTLEGDGYASLDLRASREVKFGTGKDAPAMTFGVGAFNLLNRVNYSSYVGTLSSPLFGQPVSARAPRQLQFPDGSNSDGAVRGSRCGDSRPLIDEIGEVALDIARQIQNEYTIAYAPLNQRLDGTYRTIRAS
jgi:hypothetical protein